MATALVSISPASLAGLSPVGHKSGLVGIARMAAESPQVRARADTEYFAPSTAPFMINYRVRDLDAMLAQLRASGAQVDDRVEDYDYGRFGWATDPEGNRFELWEPRPPGQG